MKQYLSHIRSVLGLLLLDLILRCNLLNLRTVLKPDLLHDAVDDRFSNAELNLLLAFIALQISLHIGEVAEKIEEEVALPALIVAHEVFFAQLTEQIVDGTDFFRLIEERAGQVF